MNRKGKLFIFSAPSGAGKTSIVRSLLKKRNDLGFSISATSRPTIREGEVDGRDYYFMTSEVFKDKIRNDEFVEWEEVYANIFYGTLRSELERIWNEGKNVVFDIDVQGGLNIKKQYPEQALAMFVKPPSVDALKSRLEGRGSENQNTLNERLKKAEWEMSFAPQFDVVIENKDLETAIEEAEQHIQTFLK